MWAQLIKARVKPGREPDMAKVHETVQANEQPGSGLLRTIMMRDQKDPRSFYTLVIFESEDKARAREKDPRRQEAMEVVRATFADALESPPEFVDLTDIQDVSP